MIDIRRLGDGERLDISERVVIDIPASFGVGSAADVVLDLVLTNTGKHFTLQGEGKCRISAECCLCLSPLDLDFDIQIMEAYAEQDSAEISEDDIVIHDKHIDIGHAVKRGLFADMPTKPLCSADCAGLCPNCGANLNQGECTCGGRVNEQFRELLQMFED